MFQPSNTTIAVSVQFLNVGMYLFSMFLFFFFSMLLFLVSLVPPCFKTHFKLKQV